MTVEIANKINKEILWKSINSINFQNCNELLHNLEKEGFKVKVFLRLKKMQLAKTCIICRNSKI